MTELVQLLREWGPYLFFLAFIFAIAHGARG